MKHCTSLHKNQSVRATAKHSSAYEHMIFYAILFSLVCKSWVILFHKYRSLRHKKLAFVKKQIGPRMESLMLSSTQQTNTSSNFLCVALLQKEGFINQSQLPLAPIN